MASVILIFSLLFLSLANAFSDPGPCSGDCWTHDVGLLQRKSDGRWFRFATGKGIHISVADSIEGPWTVKGEALPGGSSIDHPGSGNLWAPDVHLEGDTYYMYYSVSKLGSRNSVIGVASSPNMQVGSWKDHGSTGLTSNNDKPYNAIDANWIRIGGTPFLNFGSHWHDLYQVPMKGPLKITGATPYNLAYNDTGSHREEAAFEFEHDGFYYMTFSSGVGLGYDNQKPPQGEEYSIRVCRSPGGKGNFVDRDGKNCLKGGGTTLLASHGHVYGPGGQGVTNDKKHGLILYYQYADTNKGLNPSQYQFGWNKLKWEDGWPIV
ncbi:glycosyl hydrolase [Aspergillus taichungensis]|uniref:Arabinan endo-1,5-alpha-L-arabinosidase n=1 Tax=Aspergillus taichungensis TaxID=482145 RepID=A0A2J5I1A7_9EURO|nr:glycosyl hydrolase [Aspergillus taichungensis]